MTSPLDKASLERLFTEGAIDNTNFTELMRNKEFLKNPLLYETALSVINNYSDPIQLKSVIRAYEVLNCNDVDSLPIHQIRFYDFWTKSNFTAVVNSAEKIIQNNFAQAIQAKTEMFANGVELERKINQHIDSIESFIKNTGIGKEEWSAVRSSLIHNNESEAITHWNSLLAKVRNQFSLKTSSETERLLLDPMEFVKNIPPKNPKQARFMSLIPEIDKWVNNSLSDTLSNTFDFSTLKQMDEVVKNQWHRTINTSINGTDKEIEAEIKELNLLVFLRSTPETATSLLTSFQRATARTAFSLAGLDIPSPLFPNLAALESFPYKNPLDPNNPGEFSLEELSKYRREFEDFRHTMPANINSYFNKLFLDSSTYYTIPSPKLHIQGEWIFSHLDFFNTLEKEKIETIVDLRMNTESFLQFLPPPTPIGKEQPIPGGTVKYLESQNIGIPDSENNLQYIVKSKVEVTLNGSKKNYTLLQVKHWNEKDPPDAATLRALNDEIAKVNNPQNGKTIFVDNPGFIPAEMGPRAAACVLYQHLSNSKEPVSPVKVYLEMQATVRPILEFDSFFKVVETVKEDHQARKGQPLAEVPRVRRSSSNKVHELQGRIPVSSAFAGYFDTNELWEKFLDMPEPEKGRVENTLWNMFGTFQRHQINNYIKSLEPPLVFLILKEISYTDFKTKVIEEFPEYVDANEEQILSMLGNQSAFQKMFPEYAMKANSIYLSIEYALKADNKPSGPIDVLRQKAHYIAEEARLGSTYAKSLRAPGLDETAARILSNNLDWLQTIKKEDIPLIPPLFFEKYINENNLALLTDEFKEALTPEQKKAAEG